MEPKEPKFIDPDRKQSLEKKIRENEIILEVLRDINAETPLSNVIVDVRRRIASLTEESKRLNSKLSSLSEE